MKINAEITSNNELKVHFDFPENTQQQPNNVWVGYIEIFNTRSYLDGIPVYEHTYDPDIDTDNTTFDGVMQISDLSLTGHEINLYETLVHDRNGNNCYPTDLFNDIIIINVTFGYSTTYLANTSSCSEAPATMTVALYYPCPIYERAINSINGCSCNDMCENNLPYGFMYELLKKKAVDSCLKSQHYDMACEYYIKFFKKDGCGCVKKGCNCGSTTT